MKKYPALYQLAFVAVWTYIFFTSELVVWKYIIILIIALYLSTIIIAKLLNTGRLKWKVNKQTVDNLRFGIGMTGVLMWIVYGVTNSTDIVRYLYVYPHTGNIRIRAVANTLLIVAVVVFVIYSKLTSHRR